MRCCETCGQDFIRDFILRADFQSALLRHSAHRERPIENKLKIGLQDKILPHIGLGGCQTAYRRGS